MHLLLLLACSQPPTGARAWKMTSLDEGVGGPKATAQVGDFRMENEHIRLAILDAGYSLGPSPYGGTIADLDKVRADPAWGANHGNDQFAEMFATANMNIPDAESDGSVTIVNDGSDGNAADIRVDAQGVPLLTLLGVLWTVVHQPDFRLTTDYILEPGADYVTIRTQVSFDQVTDPLPAGEVLPGSTDGLDVLGLAITSGVTLGDFYLQGGSVDVFGPGIGFDEDKAVYEAAEDGRNLFADPYQLPFLGGTGDQISYGIAAATGDLYVPLFTSSQTAAFGAGKLGDGSNDRFPAGTAFVYERYLAVGDGDMGSVYDKLSAARGEVTGEVGGYVVEDGTGTPITGAEVLAYQPGATKPWNQWLTDVGEDTQKDGSFGGRLPEGDWELLVHKHGRPDSPRIPITVSANTPVELTLASPRPGQVTVHIVDGEGRPMPGKVTFVDKSGRRSDSDVGDDYLGGAATDVVFVPFGETIVVLPPGEYSVTGSRGLEYEIDTKDLTVSADGAADVTLSLPRDVDTTGWVSADFHVHAGNSFDSGVSLSDRVITMVSEGVEFFSSSDHDFLTDYAPVVQDLGLEYWVKTAIGLETTTLEVGHFIGFPLTRDTLKQNGGAFDWTGMLPDDILGSLNDMADPNVQPIRFVAHPRDGILGYFDQYGYDPYTGTVATPIMSFANPILGADNFSTNFEALELLNGKRFELIRTPTQPELDTYAKDPSTLDSYALVSRTMAEQTALIDGTYTLGYGHEGQIDDWFSLIDKGVRLTALGNSDTHGKFSIEAGCPRNFVASETDDPAQIDPLAIADSVRAGHVVASYGPFIRFWANDPANITGSEIVDTDGSVDLHVQVEAPTWMSVTRVELYQDGTLVKEWTDLDDGVVRLSEDVAMSVQRDSYFVVIAVGDGSLEPVFTPVEMPPIQLQDVVLDALADVPAVGSFLSPAIPIPRTGDVIPYALTNPIYVDVGGDGWSAPGAPAWMVEPAEPSN